MRWLEFILNWKTDVNLHIRERDVILRKGHQWSDLEELAISEQAIFLLWESLPVEWRSTWLSVALMVSKTGSVLFSLDSTDFTPNFNLICSLNIVSSFANKGTSTLYDCTDKIGRAILQPQTCLPLWGVFLVNTQFG